MNMKKLGGLMGVITMIASGCATVPYEPYAREVKRKPEEGGVIALKTAHRPEDRAKADYMMRSVCGANVAKVTEEGEVVVGEKTDSVAKESAGEQSGFKLGGVWFNSSDDHRSKTTTSSERIQIKEWQIAYQCIAKVQPDQEQILAKRTKTKKNK